MIKFELKKDNGSFVIDLRDLHTALYEDEEKQTKFADFARRGLKDFHESVDFTSLLIVEKRASGGGTRRREYQVTLDVAKHICMMLNTSKGKATRLYFLRCEKELMQKELEAQQLTAPGAVALPQDMSSALRMLADTLDTQKELVMSLQIVGRAVTEMRPKVKTLERILDAPGTFSMAEAAQILFRKGIGQNNLFKLLRESKVLIKGDAYGNDRNRPFQPFVDDGYFIANLSHVPLPNGYTVLRCVTRVTAKGLGWLCRRSDRRQAV
jgi:anti-repressor protein